MSRKSFFAVLFTLLFIGILFSTAPFAGSAAAEVQMSMGCGPSVAAGYPAGVALSTYLNKQIEGLKLIPIELGTAAAIRRVSAGEMDLTYSSAFDVVASYTNKGAFQKKPLKAGTQPYQGIWFWPVAQFMVTRADTDIHSYDDLKGKTASMGSPKEGLYAFAKAGFDALGLTQEWKERIVTGADRPQALKSKNVDAITAVAVAMNTLAGHTMQMELYVKLRALKMTPQQEATIDATPGIALMKVPAKLFKNDMGMEEIPAIGNMYGWSFAPSADAAMVYQFVKTCFENAPKLAELARTFKLFSSDPKGTVAMGLKACAKMVPVHPGAAKYYKEIGIWDASWIEGKTQ